MNKVYYSLGLMSGTSMDGVDASIIKSDGKSEYKVILNKYFQYNEVLYNKLIKLRKNIKSFKDLNRFFKEIKSIEKQITIFHARIVNKIVKKFNFKINFIGFHGQTIFHDSNKKISKQLGDGKLLSKITKKTVVYNFRKNDLKNGGEGAPLTPIFHMLLKNQHKLKPPLIILNIGGIANITSISLNGKMYSQDIGPGNCLIDKWIRQNSKKKYDYKGNIAKSGKINKIILNQSLDIYYKNDISKYRSYDINDFDLSFVRGLSLEDGAATLTEFTADIQSEKIFNTNIYVCGGGRKNKFLLERIEKKIKKKIKLIDHLGINGDFIESQAFAYLAIRSYLKLPISYPETTGCKKPCTGGIITRNF